MSYLFPTPKPKDPKRNTEEGVQGFASRLMASSLPCICCAESTEGGVARLVDAVCVVMFLCSSARGHGPESSNSVYQRNFNQYRQCRTRHAKRRSAIVCLLYV